MKEFRHLEVSLIHDNAHLPNDATRAVVIHYHKLSQDCDAVVSMAVHVLAHHFAKALHGGSLRPTMEELAVRV